MLQTTTIDWLKYLNSIIDSHEIPRSKRLWGGADVVISETGPENSEETGFYPEPRYVCTRHGLEVSWMFEQLRDAFYLEKRIDHETKIEFFGRLANAVNRGLAKTPDLDAGSLCAAVLNEAFAMYDELEKGTFRTLPLAIGNEIADDHVGERVGNPSRGSRKN